MQIIDGRKISADILAEVKREITLLSFAPVFCDILVGDDPSSVQYVRMKAKTAESVGIKFHNANFSTSITTEELIHEINILNKIENMCGIIVQLPLSAHIDRETILNAIDSRLDVDCLGNIASKKFYDGEDVPGFPTALACMAMLDTLSLDLKTKNIAVVGQGMLVGRPVAALLRARNLSPEIINTKTQNTEELMKNADVIISCVGKGRSITGDMIKRGVAIIDAGTSELVSDNRDVRASIVGDVDLESVRNTAGYVSPVPGGVGPVTVAMLLRNVLRVAKNL